MPSRICLKLTKVVWISVPWFCCASQPFACLLPWDWTVVHITSAPCWYVRDDLCSQSTTNVCKILQNHNSPPQKCKLVVHCFLAKTHAKKHEMLAFLWPNPFPLHKPKPKSRKKCEKRTPHEVHMITWHVFVVRRLSWKPKCRTGRLPAYSSDQFAWTLDIHTFDLMCQSEECITRLWPPKWQRWCKASVQTYKAMVSPQCQSQLETDIGHHMQAWQSILIRSNTTMYTKPIVFHRTTRDIDCSQAPGIAMCFKFKKGTWKIMSCPFPSFSYIVVGNVPVTCPTAEILVEPLPTLPGTGTLWSPSTKLKDVIKRRLKAGCEQCI